MCGRYAVFLPPDAMAALFRTSGPVPIWDPTWNMAPTRDAPVVRLHPGSAQRQIDLLRWGLLPHWAKVVKFGRQPMAFAGLWEGWRGADGTVVRTFTIVTTEANATLRPLHTRLPVVLEPADWALWLGEAEGDPAPLLRPSAAEFRCWRIGSAVNHTRNDGSA